MEVAQSSEDYAKRRGLFKERAKDYELSGRSLRTNSDDGPDPELLQRLGRFGGGGSGKQMVDVDETESIKKKKSKKKKKKKSKKTKKLRKQENQSSASSIEISEDDQLLQGKSSTSSKSRQASATESASYLQELREKRHKLLMRKRAEGRKTKATLERSLTRKSSESSTDSNRKSSSAAAKTSEQDADVSLLKYFERAVRRCEEQFLGEDVKLQPKMDKTDEIEIVLGEGVAAQTPVTTVNQFELAVKNCQDLPAIKAQRDLDWITWTWQEYYFDVVKAAKSIINLGCAQFDSINIIAHNSPEVAIVHFGAVFAGTLPAILYPSDTETQCADITVRTQAKVIFVDSTEQLQKYINVVEDLSTVEAFVMWGTPEDECPNSVTRYDIPVYCWEEFLALGVEVPNSDLERRLDAQNPGHCSTLAVSPNRALENNAKVCMLSHDNLNWAGFALNASLIDSVEWSTPSKDSRAGERTLSTGPLAHADNLVMDLYSPLALAATFGKNHCVYYLLDPVVSMHPTALVEQLQEIKPTGFHAVPAVYEVLISYLDQQHLNKAENAKLSAPKRAFGSFRRNKSTGSVASKSVLSRTGSVASRLSAGSRSSARSFNRGSFKSSILNITEVFSSQRGKGGLGLDNCRFLISHNSPLSSEILDDFARMQLVITECYGSNETSGIATIAPGSHKLSSLGTALNGVEVRVRPQAATGQDGELLVRGRNIMMGYMDSAADTDSKVDADGWYHTGDMGSIDSQDYVFLLGRKADSVQLSSSASLGNAKESIYLEPIERALKSKLPMLQSAVVVGHKKKHLAVLLTLACTGDPSQRGQFLTRLAPQAICHGCSTIEEAKKSIPYMTLIQSAVDWYNSSALCTSELHKVKAFMVLDRAFYFAGENAELSAVMKPNRVAIQTQFRDQIKQMYLPGFDSMKQSSYFGIKQARKAGRFNVEQGKFLSRNPTSVKLAVSSSKHKKLNDLHREEVYKTQRGTAKFVMKVDED